MILDDDDEPQPGQYLLNGSSPHRHAIVSSSLHPDPTYLSGFAVSHLLSPDPLERSVYTAKFPSELQS